MKDILRGIRSHHAIRLKKARHWYSGIDNSAEPRRNGRLLHTPTPCSCWMCGNQRPYAGPTRAELIHLVELAEGTRQAQSMLGMDTFVRE